MSIQDTTGDPYADLKKHQEEKPKIVDLVSGTVPGQLAGNPVILDQHGAKMNRSEMSGKEVQELRKQQADMKKAQFIFHIKTYTEVCADNEIRMMFQLQNEHIPSKRRTVIMEFGYSAGQLQNFINAIGEHNAEIQKGTPEGSPIPQNDATPGDPVQ